jgi:hypothetical protein
MLSDYLQGNKTMLEICKIPHVDSLHPFVWSSKTLEDIAGELESHDVYDTHYMHPPLQASCVIPGGGVMLIEATESHLTFQVVQRGELALHVEMRSPLTEGVGDIFNDFRLGVMSFATRDSHDVAKHGDVTTLCMWSERGSWGGRCEYNAIDMRNLYGGLTVIGYGWDTEDANPIWDVVDWDEENGQDEETINSDLVRAQVKTIQGMYERSWYRVEQRRERHTAIAMGLHDRLGGDSWLNHMEPEHVRMIAGFSDMY